MCSPAHRLKEPWKTRVEQSEFRSRVACTDTIATALLAAAKLFKWNFHAIKVFIEGLLG